MRASRGGRPGWTAHRALWRLRPLALLPLAGCDLFAGPHTPATLDASRLRSHVQALADDSMLGRRSASTDELRAAEYVRGWFQASGVAAAVPEYLQEFLASDDAPRRSRNVLGMVAGRGVLADEWIVVGAHYDHVGWEDVEPPVRPDCWGGSADEPCNGADDNASGTALLLDLARVFAEDAREGDDADRRSMLFAAFGAEEIGLIGSFYFCEHPPVPLRAIAAMVNLDMIGRLRDDAVTAFATETSPAWPELLGAANADTLALTLTRAVRADSDHYCFAASGIPAVFLHTGLHAEYHTPLDDVALIDVPGMERVGNLALRLLRALATRPERLPSAEQYATAVDAPR